MPFTRDFRQSTIRLKDLQEDKQVTKANERAFECLSSIPKSFAETKFKWLTTADGYKFIRVLEIANRRTFVNNNYEANASLTLIRTHFAPKK